MNELNPSVLWSQYMVYLETYSKYMKSEYIKRMRDNKSFTWNEIDKVNNQINEHLKCLSTK